jgi:putative ABC transport system permease protein
MNLASLVFANLGRNKVRTLLTLLSVGIALFLFCALRGVLDTLDSSVRVSSETRLITRNAISLIFPLPLSYRDRIAAVPGVRAASYANWFGGRDPVDTHDFYAQFAVDSPTYFPLYRSDVEIVAAGRPQGPGGVPGGNDPKLAAFFEDRTGCVVGQQLFAKHKWKIGQTVHLSGTIYPGDWPFTIQAVYRAKNPAFGENNLLFHWKYLEEKGMGGRGQVGWYVLGLDHPGEAGSVIQAIDGIYENSTAATRTETERAFQAGFVSMYGNIPFLIGLIGLAVVLSMLGVAANTMMMAIRERTGELAVLKTLGFTDGTVFAIVLAEALAITGIGGTLGALLAKFLIEGTRFNGGGFLPPMTVRWETVLLGVGIALAMGLVSGLVPAIRASRLAVVDALRRVE